jgi:glutamine cyclotransferase
VCCRDVLWESTGMHGHSSVREVDLESGKVLRTRALPKEDFGEGLTRHGDRWTMTFASWRLTAAARVSWPAAGCCAV